MAQDAKSVDVSFDVFEAVRRRVRGTTGFGGGARNGTGEPLVEAWVRCNESIF